MYIVYANNELPNMAKPGHQQTSSYVVQSVVYVETE